MTETDAAAEPVDIPVTFMPYLEKYRLYNLFKHLAQELIIQQPRDHMSHMKRFLQNMSRTDTMRLILLASPELDIDLPVLARGMLKDFGLFVITRQTIMDHYEKHDDYKPGCVDPVLLSQVTKSMTIKDQVVQDGWLMFDHPCTLREARCLQQDGVLPTITLAIMPTPPIAPPAYNNWTPERPALQQDFEGLKYAYHATLKEVHVDPSDTFDAITAKCFNAVKACAASAQGEGQGFHASGSPGVYRVALIGPRGSGRRTQAAMLAERYRLVCLNFGLLYGEARARDDDMGKRLREHGPSVEMKAEIVRRRILQKDCIACGYVITGFPMSGTEYEFLENMETPPNRIVFLDANYDTCLQRITARTTDWCTGRRVEAGSARATQHKRDSLDAVERELDLFFSEGLPEMRAAAGLTAWEVDSTKPVDDVQTKIRAAIMATPAHDIRTCYSSWKIMDNNACAD